MQYFTICFYIVYLKSFEADHEFYYFDSPKCLSH